MAQKGSPKQKNKIRKDIVNLFHKKHDKSFKRKEISRELGIHKQHYYLFKDALSELVSNGKILRLKGGMYTSPANLKTFSGEAQITRKGFAFVCGEKTEEDVFIAAQHLNTAFDGDLVEVHLFAHSRGKNKEGQIVNIISRKKTRFVGTYHHSQYYGFVVADNPKIYRDFYIPDEKNGDAKDGQKVVVELENWESSQSNPQGKIVEILGFPDEPGVDITSVVMGFGLAVNFTKDSEAAAANIDFKATSQELPDRLDLRDEIIFTVDPADAKDFDDAISLEQLKNGNYKLGVHIADVSSFVKEASEIDQEALERGTSIYLVDRVIPMLPEHLSNHLCSLNPHEDKLTYSCIMEIDPSGEIVDYQLKGSIINSKQRFTYEEVQEIIDNENSENDFAAKIKLMHQLSRMLRQKRLEGGSIDFETPEVKFQLNEKGEPVDIIPVERLHSHEMIEEFMLSANQIIAKHITKIATNDKPNPFIYRVHEKPDREKLKKFNDFVKALGYKLRVKRNVTPRDFQNALQELKGGSDEILIKEVALRTMMKAVYSTKSLGHFGLAFQDYTHFTSPIRRYPDLVVHRLLREYEHPISPKRKRALKRYLKKVCDMTSERERQALEAERESIRIKQIEWMTKHQHETFEGVISGVTSFGIFVETIPYLIEGLIRIADIDDDYYIYDEKTYSLTGVDFGRLFRIGDPVKVTVGNIDIERNEVVFQLKENFKDVL